MIVSGARGPYQRDYLGEKSSAWEEGNFMRAVSSAIIPYQSLMYCWGKLLCGTSMHSYCTTSSIAQMLNQVLQVNVQL